MADHTPDADRSDSSMDLPAPADRPRNQRSAARVVVIAGDEVLLFEDSDPGVPVCRWWVTPGGGIDPGETAEVAAVRELEEETGLRIDASQLIGPVAQRITVHGYSDQVTEQQEVFYLLRTDRYEISTAGHTEEEQLKFQSHRWWPIAELADTDAWIWPDNLLEIIAADPSAPLDLGRTEKESTLPVDAR
ncbi:NUDIX hydrolase [Enemella sp. A6]|uniref:NUDIX hydrolase n=1 Tax=Enemella sp. A6 TaxID=3440152 RepID=UPI003EBA2372